MNGILPQDAIGMSLFPPKINKKDPNECNLYQEMMDNIQNNIPQLAPSHKMTLSHLKHQLHNIFFKVGFHLKNENYPPTKTPHLKSFNHPNKLWLWRIYN